MRINFEARGTLRGTVIAALLVTLCGPADAVQADGGTNGGQADSGPTPMQDEPLMRLDLEHRTASIYTDLDLDDCMAIEPSATEEGPGWAHWQCDGLDENWPVHVFGSDLRYAVSYGENGENERAARQWFGSFNRIHNKLEWVMARHDEDSEPRPVATILRFFLSIPQKDGKRRDHPILVVTQLKPGAVCHVAYVDARANPKANVDAREAAMQRAGNFDCANEPELMGPQTANVFAE